MINIKIIECSNKDIIGTVKFYSNLVEIGSTAGDILLLSKDYINHLFYIEIIEDSVQIIPNPNIDHFLVNGKRSLSQRKLQKGDQVTYKKLTFEIESFKKDENNNYNSIISSKFAELSEEDKLYNVLVKLDQELIEIDNASN